MKKFSSGLIILDTIDVICLAFSFGGCLSYIFQKYKEKKLGQDPIIDELKGKSKILDPIVVQMQKSCKIKSISLNQKSLDVPLIRVGDSFTTKSEIKGLGFELKSKRLAAVLQTIFAARKKQREFQFLQLILAILNSSLSNSVGLRFAIGRSLNCYTTIVLIGLPASLGGFIVSQVINNLLGVILLPLSFLYSREVEHVPDPSEKCMAICEAVVEYHNRELLVQMKELNSMIPNKSDQIKIPLVCVEQKLSLLQRYKIKQLIKNKKLAKQVQNFNEFIKKFPECNADIEPVYEHIVEKIKN